MLIRLTEMYCPEGQWTELGKVTVQTDNVTYISKTEDHDAPTFVHIVHGSGIQVRETEAEIWAMIEERRGATQSAIRPSLQAARAKRDWYDKTFGGRSSGAEAAAISFGILQAYHEERSGPKGSAESASPKEDPGLRAAYELSDKLAHDVITDNEGLRKALKMIFRDSSSHAHAIGIAREALKDADPDGVRDPDGDPGFIPPS